MKILLINPPIRMNKEPYFQPIGLSIIASVLRDDHEVDILDINVQRDGFTFPIENYDLIGISGLITTYKYVYDLMPLLRERYICPIVIGGGGITSAPDEYMKNLKPDYGVLGEGERTIVELIEYIEGSRENPPNGTISKYFVTPARELADLDDLPSQAFDMFDMEAYISADRHLKRDAAIVATRGCPHNCAFCYHIFGRSFRYRNPVKVVDEMELLMNEYKAESFLFGDECITANKKNLLALCKEIVDRGLKAPWICYSRVDTIDEEMAIAMKAAGCVKIGFGLESGSQRILDTMNKGVTIEKMIDTWNIVQKHIPVSGTFIFGTPGEDIRSLCENMYFQEITGQSKKFFHLSPYPGTKFYEENIDKILAKFGNLHNFFIALGDAGDFVINLTDWSDEEYHARYRMLYLNLSMAQAIRKGNYDIFHRTK